ncbi:MAG: hypothetical protein IKA71_07520 [Lentisphaeria bacterium]|nr:hypothetical protein [Lentisphaeria bacterium]
MENNILKERFSLYKLIRYAGGLACVIAFQSALLPLLILYKISNSEHLKMTESPLPVFLTTGFLVLDGILLGLLLIFSRKEYKKHHFYCFLACEIALVILLFLLCRYGNIKIDLSF